MTMCWNNKYFKVD